MKANKGDTIQIVEIQLQDAEKRLKVGDVHKVAIASEDGDVYIDMNGATPLWLVAEEYEVISKEGGTMNGQQAKEIDFQLIEKEAQNMPLEIGFKRLSDNAILPTKAHATDSGFDLFSAQDVIIAPGETVVVPTDIAVQLPQGYEAQVRPRSGITSKTKLRIQLGTIDESYRGNIGIIVDNISQEHIHRPEKIRDVHNTYVYTITNETQRTLLRHKHGTYLIRKGDKIAQLVVQSIPTTVAVEITGDLEDSDRGTYGFGSSGI